MMREGLEISSKFLSWNNWKNTIKGGGGKKKEKRTHPDPQVGQKLKNTLIHKEKGLNN